MFQVVKRDGEIDNFRIDKITKAIKKAYDATNKQFSDDMLDMLALHVTSDFQKKIKKGKISVEDIQDSVENVLIQAGYADVAKAYILYRKQLCKSRGLESERKLYRDIFCWWINFKQLRCSYRKLLAL